MKIPNLCIIHFVSHWPSAIKMISIQALNLSSVDLVVYLYSINCHHMVCSYQFHGHWADDPAGGLGVPEVIHNQVAICGIIIL